MEENGTTSPQLPSLPWTFDEDDELKEYLATYSSLEEVTMLMTIAKHFNGRRTLDDIIEHYDMLYRDVYSIERDLGSLSNCNGLNDLFLSQNQSWIISTTESSTVESSPSHIGTSEPSSLALVPSPSRVRTSEPMSVTVAPSRSRLSSSTPKHGPVASQSSPRMDVVATLRVDGNKSNKNSKWTLDEHKLFLIGIEKYGEGDWKSISRNVVRTRSPSQVASHAQKFHLRPETTTRKRRRRSSIHDIVSVDCDSRRDLIERGLLDEPDTHHIPQSEPHLSPYHAQPVSTRSMEPHILEFDQRGTSQIVPMLSQRENLHQPQNTDVVMQISASSTGNLTRNNTPIRHHQDSNYGYINGPFMIPSAPIDTTEPYQHGFHPIRRLQPQTSHPTEPFHQAPAQASHFRPQTFGGHEVAPATYLQPQAQSSRTLEQSEDTFDFTEGDFSPLLLPRFTHDIEPYQHTSYHEEYRPSPSASGKL